MKVIVFVTSPSATVVTLPVALMSLTSPDTKPLPLTVTVGLVRGVPSYGFSAVSLVSVTSRFVMLSVPVFAVTLL